MIDKKRFITLLGIVAAGAVLITLLIVWLVNAVNNRSELDELNEILSSASPEPEPAETIDPDIAAFTPELRTTVAGVAEAVVNWSSRTDREVLVSRYKENGMSPEYATVFTPLWAYVFEEFEGAQVSVAPSTTAKIEVLDVTGDAGYRTFRVSAKVHWVAGWQDTTGWKDARNKSAVWLLTVDEHSGLVTEVDQPSLEHIDLDIDAE